MKLLLARVGNFNAEWEYGVYGRMYSVQYTAEKRWHFGPVIRIGIPGCRCDTGSLLGGLGCQATVMGRFFGGGILLHRPGADWHTLR